MIVANVIRFGKMVLAFVYTFIYISRNTSVKHPILHNLLVLTVELYYIHSKAIALLDEAMGTIMDV